MADFSQLLVFLHDEKIGTLNQLPGERVFFVFEPSYAESSKRAVLSLSFKDSFGNLITETRPTRGRVPPFFSNLLPEGPLRDYLATRAGVNSAREFFLLAALGADLPGALRVQPEGEEYVRAPSLEKKTRPKKRVLRFSLAGVQLKFPAIMEKSGGLTIPAEGSGGSWIIKLPSMRFKDMPQNEYAMMTLARLMGMNIPEIKLVPLGKISGLPEGIEKMSGEALAVRRFDRSETGPIHMEDFAQVFGVYPEDKYKRASYKNIAQVLWQESDEEDIIELIRRIVFNTLIGNADMHLKNFSLIYPDRQKAKLAPGYDFVSTIVYIADENMALKYVRSRHMADFSLKQLEYFAIKSGLPQKLVLDAAKETVMRFRDVWQQGRKNLPLNSITVTTIDKHAKAIPIFFEVKG